MTRDRKDSQGFEDLADELDAWDATFDSLHEEDGGNDAVLKEARKRAETAGPSFGPGGSAEALVPANLSSEAEAETDLGLLDSLGETSEPPGARAVPSSPFDEPDSSDSSDDEHPFLDEPSEPGVAEADDEVTPTPGAGDELVAGALVPRPPTTDESYDYEYDFGDDDEVEIRIVDTAPTPDSDDDALFPTIADPGPVGYQDHGSDIALGRLAPFGGGDATPLSPFDDSVKEWGPEADVELPQALGSLLGEEVQRRGPAIVRRDELERRRQGEALHPTLDDDAASEWDVPVTTNVMAQATVDKMIESAAAFFDDDEPDEAPVEFELDDEFYDDIEIDESADAASSAISSAPIAMEPSSGPGSARTLAHIVRRNPTPTLESARVVQLDYDDDLDDIVGELAAEQLAPEDVARSSEAAVRAITELESEQALIDPTDIAADTGADDADDDPLIGASPFAEDDRAELDEDLDNDLDNELEALLATVGPSGAPNEADFDVDVEADVEADIEIEVGDDHIVETRAITETGMGGNDLTIDAAVVPPPALEPAASPLAAADAPPRASARAPSVLTRLVVDVPPQLPPMRVAGASADPLDSIVLTLPEAAVAQEVEVDTLATQLETAMAGAEALERGPRRAAFHRWASSLAFALGDVTGADTHGQAAEADLGGDESGPRGAARRARRAAARNADWEAYADGLESAAASAGENAAAGLVALSGDLGAALGRPGLTRTAVDGDDIGAMFRAAITAARGGEAKSLASQFHALAESVADDQLRVALVSAWLRADASHEGAGGVSAQTLESAVALAPEVSNDLVMWQVQPIDGAARVATARTLADTIEQSSDPALADSFRIIAGDLAGSEEGLADLTAVAGQRAAHPWVARPLLENLGAVGERDEDLANVLVAVASGGPFRSVASRSLRRWAIGAEGAVRAERLRRALALNPGDALTIALLEGPTKIGEADSDEAEVGLALAPRRSGDVVDILNRARAAHQRGETERRDQVLGGVQLPVDRLLVAGEILGYAGSKEDAGVLAEAASGSARSVLSRVAAVAQAGEGSPTSAWSMPPVAAEIEASSMRGDRLAVRMRLAASEPDDDALWAAAQTWPEQGGRVQMVLSRLGSRLGGGPLGPEEATAALSMIEELSDPRVRWLAAVALGRSGDWQRAADQLVGDGDAEIGAAGRYRAGYLLLEHADDASAAESVLAPLLEDQAPPGAVLELANAARRHLGLLGPEAPSGAKAPTSTGGDPFARAIRGAEAFERAGDWAGAVAQYTSALSLRPADPIARAGIDWVAASAIDAAPAAELALADLRAAEEERDVGARADAYEKLARIDDDISGDSASALLAWESAADCDPMRASALRALEVAYVIGGRHRDLLKVYGRLLAIMDEPHEEAALRIARSRVAELSGRDPGEVMADWTAAHELDPLERMALFQVEARARGSEPSAARAEIEARVATLLVADPRSAAAFLCRSAETLASLGDYEGAIARYREATAVRPGHLPSLEGWRDAAWRIERWDELAAACQLESQVRSSDDARARLLHLGGVALMDKALDGAGATAALETTLAVGGHDSAIGEDTFARLWQLFDETGNDERLGDLFRARLETATEPDVVLRLHLELASLCRNFWNDREGACAHLAAALKIEPLHRGAVADLSDISWELGAWDVAAETLLTRARLETSPRALKHIFYRLGTIYADHLPDPRWAIKCFRTALSHDPTDTGALERLASLARLVGDDKMALGVFERLLKLDISDETKVRYLHEVAEIQTSRGKTAAAERAVRVAFDLAPHSRTALGVLLKFYQNAGDISSVRVNLDRAAQSMRARLAHRLDDTQALAVIGRVLTVRERAGVPGSLRTAQVAAELARALGEESQEVRDIASGRAAGRPSLAALSRLDLDDLLAPRTIPPGLRVILRALRDRIGKFVGADPKRFGVSRSDRLKRGKHPIASLAAEMAVELGVRGAEIYVSSAALGAAMALPTTPTALILGSRFASMDRAAELTFALGRGLKLGQMGLALVDTMTAEELDLLVAGIIRQFAPEWPGFGQTADVLAAEQHRLRRLVPGGLVSELRHHALALTGAGLAPGSLHAAIRQLGLRAGLLASTNAAGALAATLRLGGHSSIQEASGDQDVVGLIRFAVSEQHVEIQAALAEEPS